MDKKQSWLTSREDVRVFDCTIRDGGLVNKYQFKDEFVSAVYYACLDSGIDYMEIGKIVSPKIMSEDEYGAWNFCKEEDIRRIVGENDTDLKLAVMADIGRTFTEDIKEKKDSVVDMIRIATYIHQIPKAIELIEDAHQKGYETTVNLMAISKVFESDLDEALDLLCKTNVDIIYIADSFGYFYPEQINKLTKKYVSKARACGKKVGIHAHNNQQLAYANTIETMIGGTSYLDVTFGGLGRGAGNCPTELLLGFLRNPKYKLRPVLKFLQDYIDPLKKELNWGYNIPYMLTGQLNEHPKSAIEFTDKKKSDYVKFNHSLLDVQE